MLLGHNNYMIVFYQTQYGTIIYYTVKHNVGYNTVYLICNINHWQSKLYFQYHMFYLLNSITLKLSILPCFQAECDIVFYVTLNIILTG